MNYLRDMKNLDQLKTGGKPAPGNLVIVQGLVNTADIEEGTDAFETRELLKSWLVRHGLLRAAERVSAQDHRLLLSFRESLRRLLLANNGAAIKTSSLRQLNQLAKQYPLELIFKADGACSLSTAGRGVAGVIGQIFAQIVIAIGENTWPRLKACRDPNCRWAFFDSSKNQSGKWCSMSVCGSRDKARAYRKRQSTIRQNPDTRQ